MLIIFTAFFVSFIVTVLIVRYQHIHGRFSHDHSESGPQKFHVDPTPRIGGVPLIIGTLAGLIMAWVRDWSHNTVLLLLLCALPVWGVGILEDVTKRINPNWRLLAAFSSAALAFWMIDAELQRLDIAFLDQALHWAPLSLLLTIVAVGGVSHSFNIIDGYNGLAAIVSLLILAAIIYVSLAVNDFELVAISLSLMGATFGFLLLNYPRGLIFAGDGGAYLWGFIIAELSILLVVRHDAVSPWFPMLLVIYPVWETLFSIYRRRFIRGASPGLPDALHLHQLIYFRLARWMVGNREAHHMVKRNAMTSPYLWGIACLSIAPALIFWENSTALIICLVLFIVIYGWLYRKLVRFRAPRLLIWRNQKTNKETLLS